MAKGKTRETNDREWHLITCEYPPAIGGVADYTRQIAMGLASRGNRPVVWAPGNATGIQTHDQVPVYRCFGRFRPQDIWAASRLWAAAKNPKRILLQWEPAGYGLKSSNLPFCLWLAWRAIHGDQLFIFFHESFLSLSEGPLRRRLAALVERLMTILLLNTATRAFVSTSSWIPLLTPYSFGKTDFITMPIPANVAPGTSPQANTHAKRSKAPQAEQIIGHFGLYSPSVELLLIPSLLHLMQRNPHIGVSLIGAGSTRYRETLLSKSRELSDRVYATGPCSHVEASAQILACDAMFQPYSDGISTRRGTTMAALAHGKHLISTSGINTEEIWKLSSAVHLIASREPRDIALAIEEALSTPSKAIQRGDEGLKLYQEHFALPHTIDALLREAAN